MPQSKLILKAIDHLVLTVADIEATCVFYSDVLGMRAESFETKTGERRQALYFGRLKINLHQQGAEFEPKAQQATPGSADLCFLTDQPLDQWLAHLAENGVQIEAGPLPRTGARHPLRSIYLRDPDGNLIEIATEHSEAG
ncbi:MAG: VOC family protein [Sulfitobacter sp.]|nr:VOC family protein [Sulfitobacter sp.]